jgi:hypothetical protein
MTDMCSVCGQPTAAHFTDRKRKLTCEQLHFRLALHVGQHIAYWRGRRGHATVQHAQIMRLSPDRNSATVLYNGRRGGIRCVRVDTFRFLILRKDLTHV